MRYLILILFVSCNQYKAKPVFVPSDSATRVVSSLTDSLKELNDNLGDYVDQVKAKISKLEKENASLRVNPSYMTYRADSSVKLLAMDYYPTETGLLKRLRELENENARLKRRIYTDSMYYARIDKVPNEPVELKPDDSSLIIKPVPNVNMDIYLIPYPKKEKKIKPLLTYEYSCDVALINKLGGRISDKYKGQYFFNDVPPGKYLVKLCTYVGNYMVFERTSEKQVITLATSPPIK